jgi:hypothetical protein
MSVRQSLADLALFMDARRSSLAYCFDCLLLGAVAAPAALTSDKAGREAKHQSQKSSFVELRRGFAGSPVGWGLGRGDQNSGDFIDLLGS